MSSKYLTILLAVAALLLTTSCSNDDMDNLLANGPVSAQVTASINNGNAVTRISDATTFAASDVINVVADGTNTYTYTYTNSDGTYSWVGTTPYYFEDGSDVSFTGWSSATTTTGRSISIDTSSQSADTNGWNYWDILTAPAVTANIASPEINFTGDNAFSHIMSKVTFNFSAGTGISDLTKLTGYTIKDITTTATFSTNTCALSNGNTTGDISQTFSGVTGTSYSSSIILVPQDVTTLSLEVTYNEQTYVVDLTLPDDATALVAGTHYTFNVTINNESLSVTASIEDWTDKGTQTGTAEKVSYIYNADTKTFIVYDEDGLNAWATYISTNEDYTINCTLAADITMSTVESGSNWTDVFNNSNQFTGTFDGNGKTISGLTMNATTTYEGFIGYLGTAGVVKNLTLKDVSMTTNKNYFGAIVGRNEGGLIVGCTVTGTITVTDYSKERTGGIVGWNSTSGDYTGAIIGCSFSGTISGAHQVGGIVGYNVKGEVTACYSTGTITGSSYVGGIVGENNGSTATVTACYSTAAVSYADQTSVGSDDDEYGTYIGGVVGNNSSSGTVSTCYWNNSTTDYGIGSSSSSTGSNDNATKVDGTDVTWSTASTTMNGVLDDTTHTDDDGSTYYWQYSSYTEDSDPPLTLTKVTQ